MKTTLNIHLFGSFLVCRGEQPLTVQQWRSRQTRTILKVLAAHQGKVVPADQICHILWPDDLNEDMARRRLHVRISQLRQVVDTEASQSNILTVDGGYALNRSSHCWLDVVAFETAVTQGRSLLETKNLQQAITTLEQARQLYRGDFLTEDIYAPWTFLERERLRETYLTLLTELAEAYALQGRYRQAIRLCREVLTADSCREALYVRLMLYHYYAGEQDQALRMFARCQQVLAEELDVTPLPETAVLAKQIRAGTLLAETQDSYPPPVYDGRLFAVPYSLGSPPLVGREREYAWLVERWHDSQTRLIFVEGRAGIGKTHLLRAFIGFANERGETVLRSRLTHEENQPYAPIVAGLGPLLSHNLISKLSAADRHVLASLFPDLDKQEDGSLSDLLAEQAQQRLFEAIETLVTLALPDGGIWVLDDAQRASSASLALLARLTKQLLIVLAYRSEETAVTHPLRHITPSTGRAATLTLVPLPQTAVNELLTQLAQSELPTLVDNIISQSEGNPLFIIALLQHMFEEGLLYVDGNGRWRQAGACLISLPPTIRQTIEARLHRLNRSQRQLFDIAAVLGGEFDFDLLRHISREPEESVLDLLDALLDKDLLTEPRTSGRKEFTISHDYYVEVAYDTLPTIRRRQLHQRSGDALEQVYSAALSPHYPALAYHFRQAQNKDRERHYAQLAGEQAADQFANEEAVTLLSRALDLTPTDDTVIRFKLLSTLEKVADVLGDREKQQQHLQTMATLSPQLSTAQQAELLLRQANYAWALSDFPQTIALAQETIQLAQQCGVTAIEAAAYLLWGKVDMDQSTARKTLAKAQRLAQQAESRSMEGTIVRCLGNACYWQGNYAECKAFFDEALQIHREVGDRRGELSALNNLGYLAHLQGKLATAVSHYENALQIAKKIGDRLGEGVLTSNLGYLTINLGDIDRAQTYSKESLVIRREVDDLEGVGCVLRLLGDIARNQGDYEKAELLCQQSAEILQKVNLREYGGTLDIFGLIQLDRGHYSKAQNYFEQALNTMQVTQAPEICRTIAHLGQLSYLQGKHERACDYSQQALEQCGDDIQVQATALTTLGHAFTAMRQTIDAQQAYQQALYLRHKMGQHHLTEELMAALQNQRITNIQKKLAI